MEVLMRIVILVLFTVVCATPTTGWEQSHPSPPGLREAEKQRNKPLEPPVEAKRKPPEPAQLKQEADELAQLSSGIPADIGLVGQGQLPKDLGDRLKRIEKLAKHLRTEILP
jgi:hypothetical protein